MPIAVGLLAASEQVPLERLENTLFIGELSLDGSLRHIDGVLPMAYMAQHQGIQTVFLPEIDAPEAALIRGLEVIPVPSMSALVSHLRDFDPIPAFEHSERFDQVEDLPYTVDFADIKAQEHVKRALEVAAAGGHNCLMTGSPGAGKTLLARSLPSVLPKLSLDEALDITRIYSVTGQLPPGTPLVNQRPFRSPHHTISNAGLVGGGRLPRPGEISLAHRGVLFLDELPEFGPKNLETLRQPLEDKVVTISRAQGSLSFPANFMLVGAMNPCPCGWYGFPLTQYAKRPCPICTAHALSSHHFRQIESRADQAFLPPADASRSLQMSHSDPGRPHKGTPWHVQTDRLRFLGHRFWPSNPPAHA
ncbi:MAG: ATP-binding protein [Anaerolineae bacterium]